MSFLLGNDSSILMERNQSLLAEAVRDIEEVEIRLTEIESIQDFLIKLKNEYNEHISIYDLNTLAPFVSSYVNFLSVFVA